MTIELFWKKWCFLPRGTSSLRSLLWLSRKGTLLTSNIFALTGSLLMGLSYITRSFELLIVGRLLIGINSGEYFRNTKKKVFVQSSQFGSFYKWNIWKCSHSLGIGLCVQALYLGEIAPTALRGTMGMGTSIFITAGILLGQVVGLRYAQAMIFRQNPNFSWAAKLRYDVTVSSWAERSTGPSCCPLHVSQRSCSCSHCPGSPRVHVICSSTAEKRRHLKKVDCQHFRL